MLRKFFLNRKSKPRNFYILGAVTMPIAIATAILSWTAGGSITNILTWLARGSTTSLIAVIMLIGPISWSFYFIGVARTLSRVEKNKIHRVPQRTPLRRGMVIFLNIFWLLALVFSIVGLARALVYDSPLFVVLFNVCLIIVTGGHFFFAPLDDYIFYSRSLWRFEPYVGRSAPNERQDQRAGKMRKLFILCSIAALLLLLGLAVPGYQLQAEVFQHNERGVQLNKEGRYDEAIAEFNKAVELDPKYAPAYANRGNAYSWKGDYDKAIADYNKAVELDPKYAPAYCNRGTAYSDKGDYDKAIADYNKAIELNPKYAQAYANRGNAYNYMGQYDLAITDSNKAIKLDPKYAPVYYYRGAAYYVKGQYDKAIADFNKVIELSTDPALTQNAREMLKRLGQ